MYKSLKRVRVGVSVVFAALLTWGILDAGFGLTRFGALLLKAQLVPAILAGSMAWLVAWIVITLLVGRVYCSSVCPMGTLQDAGGYLGRHLSRGAGRRYRYCPPMNGLRFPIPVIAGACLLLGVSSMVEATDPYSLYRKIVLAVCRPAAIGLGSLALASVVALAISAVAWKRGRLLCNTACPVGGLLGLLSRNPIYRVDINTDKCIHCGKCEDVCKSCCIDLKDHVVDNSRCVMCMDCTTVCPNEAITVRRGRHTLSLPMMQPTCTMQNMPCRAHNPAVRGCNTSDENPSKKD